MSRYILIVILLITHLFIYPPVKANADQPYHTQQQTFDFRPIHMGGNWGQNRDAIKKLPQEYFNFLYSVHANWVGMSIAIFVDDAMDSTVSHMAGHTFDDVDILNAIEAFRENDFHVYLTLAFETNPEVNPAHPVSRWQLGDPVLDQFDPNIQTAFWPWSPNHPNHTNFIRKFWETYTEEAVHFATLAEQGGADMFSLGTETERLFRSRSGNGWPNHFLNELKAMVDSVRHVFSGLITYDMHKDAVTGGSYYSTGSDYLWSDIGLDVVGISAYFSLIDSPPLGVMEMTELENAWGKIFQDYLTPLQNRNPGKPILFLEFGYVDAIGSPHLPSQDEFQTRVFQDQDNNEMDDGQETQANVYEAFFNVNEMNDRLVMGAFLWGNDMSGDQEWANSFGQMRTFAIRDKMSEDVVRDYYSSLMPIPAMPVLITPEDGTADHGTTIRFSWEWVTDALYYQYQVSQMSDFSTLVFDTTGMEETTIELTCFQSATDYFWRVSAVNDSGQSDWSESFQLTTLSETTIKNQIIGQPVVFQLFQNYPNPFNPSTKINYQLAKSGHVKIIVYDMQGRRVKTLFNKVQQSGCYHITWHGNDHSGQQVASGTYILRLIADEVVKTQNILLIR